MTEDTNECSICYDIVNKNNNCVITECGHCFHTTCLMKNVALNGYSCPLCRRSLGKEDDDTTVTTTELYGTHRNSDASERSETMFGVTFRDLATLQTSNVQSPVEKPSPAFITEKLIEQGITMEQLVKALLKDHDEYDVEETEFINIDDDLFGVLRTIISNYTT
jgi:hypothetical protein